jgi:hypothetical protein
MCSPMAQGACGQQDGCWLRQHRFGLSTEGQQSELVSNFPFTPYDIQLEFMRELYECVAHGKMGLFESPTGTGEKGQLEKCADQARAIDRDGRYLLTYY